MPHLDASSDLQAAAARGARVAFDRIANVGGHSVLDVPVPVGAREMRILLVGSRDEIGEVERAVIDVQSGYLQCHRADEAQLGPGHARDALRAGHAERTGDSRQLLRLERVQFMVPAHDERDYAVVIAIDEKRLHAGRCRYLQEARQLLDRANAGCRRLVHRFRGRRARLRWR